MAELFRYAAFISYSSKDAAFARRVHRALESYRIPKSLGSFDVIGGGKKNRIFPVFRDREELSAGVLGELIEASLRASAALIVICSPNSAASSWVNKEIEFFASLGRPNRIFTIIANDAPLMDSAGTDATSAVFPPALGNLPQQSQPIAADVRKGRDLFRLAILKLVAGLINANVGALVDRDRARSRGVLLRNSAASFTALLTVGAGVGWFAAQQGQVRAQTLAELARRATEQGYYDRAARYALAGLSSPEVLRLMGLNDRDAEAELRRASFSMAAYAEMHAENGRMQTLACSKDGAFIATAVGNTISLWSAADGVLIRSLAGHDGPVGHVAISDDGARLASSSSADDTMRVWDVQTGRQLLRVEEQDVGDIAIIGRAIVFLSEQRGWAFRGLSDGALLYESFVGATWAKVSPDGSRLLTQASVNVDENVVQLWDLSTGRELAVLRLPIRRVLDARFTDDAAFVLVTGASDVITAEHSTARIFNVMTGQEVATESAADFILTGSFSPSGELFVTAGWGDVEVWRSGGVESDPRGLVRVSPDRVRRNLVATLRGQAGASRAVFCGETRVVSLSPDVGARAWNIEPPMPARTFLNAVIDSYDTDRRVVVSGDSAHIATFGAGNSVRIWNANGQLLRTLSGHTSLVHDAAFSPDGTTLVTASWDQTVRLWSVFDGEEVAVLRGHTGEVDGVAFSRDGSRIVSGAADGTARVWSVSSRREEQRFEAPSGARVYAVAFTPDGQQVIADANGVRIWDLATREMVATLEARQPIVFDRSGRRMITGTMEGGAIWEVGTWRTLKQLAGGTMLTAEFSPNGERIAVGSEFGLLILDAVTGRELSRVPVWGQFTSVGYGADGAWVVSAPASTLIPAIFNVHQSTTQSRRELIASVCARLRRGMSDFAQEELREAPALDGARTVCAN
jgi:WD40 repeat protein